MIPIIFSYMAAFFIRYEFIQIILHEIHLFTHGLEGAVLAASQITRLGGGSEIIPHEIMEIILSQFSCSSPTMSLLD